MKKILILLCSLLITSQVYAKDEYAIEDIKMTNNSNKIIAIITKGSKVNVLKQKGNLSYISIKGWSYEEEPNEEIFPEIGVTVTLAKIEENFLKNRVISSKEEDIYEEVWLENSISGWVNTNKLTKNFDSLWTVEAKFANERCGACHSEPKADNYAAVQFPSLINGMKETAGLSDEEESFIINFYQKNKIYKNKK